MTWEDITADWHLTEERSMLVHALFYWLKSTNLCSFAVPVPFIAFSAILGGWDFYKHQIGQPSDLEIIPCNNN